jgi:tetrahydromethanopterin S-methyltransferase subunit G
MAYGIKGNQEFNEAMARLEKIDPALSFCIRELYQIQTGVMGKLAKLAEHVGYDLRKEEATPPF